MWEDKRLPVHGFALPTVMITSVVMLIMLLTGLVTVSSANVGIRNQYYNQLAKEAAESGVNFMVGCIRSDVTPSSSSTFTPQSTSCSNATANGGKSAYVLDTSGSGGVIIKTRYTVNGPTVNASGYYDIASTGYVELYRTSSPSVAWSTQSRTVNLRIQTQSLFPNYSSSGSELVCGLLNYKSYCWGSNQDGRLGNGTIDAAGQTFEADTDNQLGLYNGGNPVVTRVVRPGDTVSINGTISSSPNQANSQLLHHEVAIAAGGGYACAVTTTAADGVNGQGQHSSRKVVCWGDTLNGQLGNNNSSGSYFRYPVNTVARWETDGTYAQYPTNKITSNGGTACIIAETRAADTDGNTWCWGNNSHGQVGFNNTSQAYYQVPKRVYNHNGSSTGVTLKQINSSPNSRNICGIVSNNRGVCWGYNGYGNTGDNTDGSTNSANLKKPLPIIVQTAYGEELYTKDISPGGSNPENSEHVCAVGLANSNSPNIQDGKLYCWGSNTFGEIGQGTADSTHYKRANLVASIRDITGTYTTNDYTATKVVSSNLNSCAIISVRFSGAPLNETTYHNELACWGDNSYGQIGIGQPGSVVSGSTIQSVYGRPTIVPFFTGKTIKAIDGGAFRFCAVVSYSNYCWGRDYAGQVGDGQANTAEYTPKKSIFLEPDYTGLTY